MMATFSSALASLKDGKRIARDGWNGKGMWLVLVPAKQWSVTWTMIREPIDLLPWIGMKTADNKFVPWLASQTDILAEDWIVIGE